MMDRILDKISKLLKLAESPNIEEASSAMEKAHQLLKEHNLQISDIKEKSNLSEVVYGESGRIMNWKKILLNEICSFNYCTVLLSNRHKVKCFVIYGREENIVASKVMYEYLVSAIDRIAYESRRKEWLNVNDFKNGAVRNIVLRLKLLKIKEKDEEKALMPISKEAEDFMFQQNSNLREVSIQTKNSSSLGKGFQRAESISLNSQVSSYATAGYIQ